MVFSSTRDVKIRASLSEALFHAVAPDGSLWMPSDDFDILPFLYHMDDKTSYTELVSAIAGELFRDEINPLAAERMAKKSCKFTPFIRDLDDSVSVLELFSGPSLSFKDYGMSFLAALMDELLPGKSPRARIIVATTGDTGSAAAHAFARNTYVDVVLLYPPGRIRGIRPEHLARQGGNVRALTVNGSFDDARNIVQTALHSRDFTERHSLTAASSVNIGRFIPQVFPYAYAFSRTKSRTAGDFFYSVPSGNYGNLAAGLLAWKWGLPTNGFIAAMNVNDAMSTYFKGGNFVPRPSVRTYSRSMDVGNPENFERIDSMSAGNPKVLSSMIHPYAITDAETLSAISTVYKTYGVFLDPHTAVGFAAAESFRKAHLEEAGRIILLGTAHAGKYADTVERATGIRPSLPEEYLASAADCDSDATVDPNLEDLDRILTRFGL